MNCTDTYCIVGAGAAGLAIIKSFRQQKIPCHCLERESAIGGLWKFDSPSGKVHESTHLVSSKFTSIYDGFPMPEDYPFYPNHLQVLDYLNSFAERFTLAENIQFNASVEKISREGQHWQVFVQGENEPRIYRGVVIANGHYQHHHIPKYPGTFKGDLMHSGDFKTSDVLRGKTVLIVGNGVSGCDIAVEAAIHAKKAFQSVRRGYHHAPKFLFGEPSDQAGEWLSKLRVPNWVHRWLSRYTFKAVVGDLTNFGLPQPDHKFLDEKPIPNTQILHMIGHGRLTVRPQIERFENKNVHFVDGSVESIDVIIFATGYEIKFPFLDDSLLAWRNGYPILYMNIFDSNCPNLFFAGLIDATFRHFKLCEDQGRLIGTYIRAIENDSPAADWFAQKIAQGDSHSQNSKDATHYIAVDHYKYLHTLDKCVSGMNKRNKTHSRVA